MNPEPSGPPIEATPADLLLDLVGDALDLPPGERTAFLQAACGDDTALQTEACSLVEHARQAGGFLEEPAYAHAAGEDLGGGDAGSLAPGTMLGEHRLLSLLGEGGMGEVYLAEDTKLERRVAVKLLKHRLDDASLARHFRHEQKVLAALNHPNIARLYGGGATPEGRSYLVMEYVEGEQLDRFCDSHALGVSERLALFRKVCAAVAYAHQNLVVHRDLKPANIRVTAEGEPKLLDFGIAKLLDPEGGTGAPADPTVTLQGAMTPEYASPEQLKGETITTASDVYSLGVVLYELLCGQRPYAALKSRRPDELVRAICEEEPPRPSIVAGKTVTTTTNASAPIGQAAVIRKRSATLRRQLEGDLDNIVAKALRQEPSRRYPGVSALSEDLRRHGEGLPVSARRDTLGYRSGKFVRRNKAGVLAATLVLLALIGGLVATAWQARVARQERDRARAALTAAESARKQSEQINNFLQKLLGGANTARLGKDAKIVQAVDAASANVDQTLANEPEVLAAVHQTLGATYLNLGMLAAAEVHCRAALALCRRLYGAEDDRTVRAEGVLALELAQRRNNDEGLPLLRHVVGWLRQHPKGNEGRLANNLGILGGTLMSLHRVPEAERAISESVAVAGRASGENSLRYANCLAQLGALKDDEGDFEEALGLHRRSLAILLRVAPDTVEVVINELNQCATLVDAGRYSDIQTLLEQTKRDCRRIVGENDNFLYTNVMFLSELLDFQRGDFAKVAGGGKEVLDRCAAYLPPDSENVVTANYLLGASLTRTGDPKTGEPYLRTALTNFNPAHRSYFLVYGNAETALGDCLLAQKRYAEAEPLLLKGYALLNRKSGKQPTGTTQSAARLHDLYTAWNKPEQAAHFGNEPASPASAP